MKVSLVILFLSLFHCVYSQEVKNVQVTQTDGNVVVKYDLADSSRHYLVSLLYSDNNGETFSEPLEHVEGDVKRVIGGANKKIIWNGEKELGYFSGEMIFRVSAKVAAKQGAIDSQSLGGLTLDLLQAKAEGKNLTIYFTAVSSISAFYKIDDRHINYILTEEGRKVKYSVADLDGGLSDNWTGSRPNLRYWGTITIDNFPSYYNYISLLTLNISEADNKNNINKNVFEFTDITVER
jgi:hypothetical protein